MHDARPQFAGPALEPRASKSQDRHYATLSPLGIALAMALLTFVAHAVSLTGEMLESDRATLVDRHAARTRQAVALAWRHPTLAPSVSPLSVTTWYLES